MIRVANETDLEGLLKLYTQLKTNPLSGESDKLTELWYEIIYDKNHYVIVADKDGEIVSTCVLIIIPNLTHNQRSYALIENVITNENHRNKGFASACLNYAKEIAIKENCYKIMLMTGSKSENTLKFYEHAGYNRNDKTAFIQWL
ncbi:MAG: GNAT family N-acetyltransferase [Clostridiales bacterium GWF2_38_85]|nr:MAG: GNAT family N-acetyltransferase [Clostridiales bacterium GWF2_38_85]HBL83675.1 GNAT family N-acetyltransferase [Clostridiales bacterium]